MVVGRARQVTVRVLWVLGIVLTVVCLVLLIGTWRGDIQIGTHTGRTAADVLSVSAQRTIVRYTTPDGAVHIPPDGVMYPRGLHVGDRVRVEYDTTNTDHVKVAGRGFSLALLPIGTLLLVTWVIIGPLLWGLRRRTTALPKP